MADSPGSGNMAQMRVALLRSALLACALTLLLAITAFTGTASARPESWKPFCAQLELIKKTSETPGGWTTFPNDRFGKKTFARYYANLKRVAPSSSLVTLLKSAHPILANPLAVAQSSKAARVAFRAMEPTVTKRCRVSVSDVFKVSVG
jgi:hypothetical protein